RRTGWCWPSGRNTTPGWAPVWARPETHSRRRLKADGTSDRGTARMSRGRTSHRRRLATPNMQPGRPEPGRPPGGHGTWRSLRADRLAKPLGQFPLLLLPVFRSDGDGWAGVQPFEQKDVDPLLGLALLVGSDEIADIFADATISALGDAFLHEVLHRF